MLDFAHSRTTIRFSWDPRVSSRTLLERGFDLEFATGIFTGATVEFADIRRDDGAVRRVATGLSDGIALTVLYVERADSDGVPRRHLLAARQALVHDRHAHCHTAQAR